MDLIHSFSVLPFTGISDHCCLSTCIRVNKVTERSIENNVPEINDCIVHPLGFRYTYNEKQGEMFEKKHTKQCNLGKT